MAGRHRASRADKQLTDEAGWHAAPEIPEHRHRRRLPRWPDWPAWSPTGLILVAASIVTAVAMVAITYAMVHGGH